ncbi:MAG: histidine kinase dimerization/phospho-acceptor domain-containing protein [Solirubrobacterales bacterium]
MRIAWRRPSTRSRRSATTSAVFESLAEAVIVVDPNGDVRFANPPPPTWSTRTGPSSRRCAHGSGARRTAAALRATTSPSASAPSRSAPAICRRSARRCWSSATAPRSCARDQAEREFVSNAAHELRNPIAGVMSGAIEVLRSGAKDDPEAREHFLDRLAIDVDRVSRLTKALLTLARWRRSERAGGGRRRRSRSRRGRRRHRGSMAVSLDTEVEPDLVSRRRSGAAAPGRF